MKSLKLVIALITSFALFSCEKPEQQTEVEKYVNALKNGQYADRDLPAFTDKHIDELLKYRNEKDSIMAFPRNLLSSSYLKKCELGIYILWTIESIRAVAIDSPYLTGRFPSQNPVLKLRSSEGLEPVFDAEAYQIVSNAYYTWWTSSEDENMDEKMKTDPLENTPYTWH